MALALPQVAAAVVIAGAVGIGGSTWALAQETATPGAGVRSRPAPGET